MMPRVEVGLTNKESARNGNMRGPPRQISSNYSFRDACDRDANLYLKCEAERMRPAHDLLARLTNHPRYIVDLGCGSGTSTQLLVQGFPDAEIVGVDNSIPMLAAARKRLPGVRFEHIDIAAWRPSTPPELVFANNALQWLPEHNRLLPQLLSMVADDGALAFQMPDDQQEPSHALMRMVAAEGPWSDRLVPIAKTRAIIGTHADYYRWLRPLCTEIDIWQTTYVRPLNGVGALVDWFRGGALKPFLDPLDDGERKQFLERYACGLSEAYPVEPDGHVLFLSPRLFVAARKRGRS
jgi:trans-aconitate 2-methyltransferase